MGRYIDIDDVKFLIEIGILARMQFKARDDCCIVRVDEDKTNIRLMNDLGDVYNVDLMRFRSSEARGFSMGYCEEENTLVVCLEE
jgi:hypothetical protein